MDINKQETINNEATKADAETRDKFPILPRRQLILTLIGIMLALFLASLDQSIVGTAMPNIIADLGGFAHYTWVTTAYLVASTAMMPTAGKLSDIYGRKLIYIGGIVIFLLGSVLSGFSQNMTQLIIFRAFQGIGGGVMMTNVFIIIADLFPPAERGKYMGLFTGIFGLAAIIGPLIGGFITDNFSWHWVFYINLPLGIPAVIFSVLYFPHMKPVASGQRINFWCMAALVLAVVSLMLALSWGGSQYPWVSIQVLGTMAFAITMTGVFLLIDSRAPEPLIPLEIFKNRIVSTSLIVIFLTGFVMLCGIMFIPLFFQCVLGSSAATSGSLLIPMMLGIVAGSLLSGQLLSRAGGHYRIQGLVGLAITGTSMFLNSRMAVDTSHGQTVFNIILMGFGLGMTGPVFTIAIQNAVSHRLMGVATSTTQFIRAIGGTLWIAVLGSFMTSRFASDLEANVSPAVKEVLQPGQLSALAHNPQALVNPSVQAQLQTQFNSISDQGPMLFQQLMDSLKHALSSAIREVFLIGLGGILIAWVVTIIFQKEIPLQKRNQEKTTPPVEQEEVTVS